MTENDLKMRQYAADNGLLHGTEAAIIGSRLLRSIPKPTAQPLTVAEAEELQERIKNLPREAFGDKWTRDIEVDGRIETVEVTDTDWMDANKAAEFDPEPAASIAGSDAEDAKKMAEWDAANP